MNKKVAITGMGIISAIGENVEANFKSLEQGNYGISDLEILETRHRGKLPAGEIKKTNEQLATKLDLPKNHLFTRSALLGGIAIREALASAEIQNINEVKTGLVSSTTVGGMDMTERYYPDYWENNDNDAYIEVQHAGYTTQKMAELFGINGLVTTLSTACSSSANAIMFGARLIKSGRLDRVIVGGTDCLSRFTLNGFNSLMILSDAHCMPFDHYRNGLNLGEGAAYLVLEADHVIKAKKKKVMAHLEGYANANDAFHQTASSEEGKGAFLAMKKALEVAGCDSNEISYINAHGTATPNNDASEGQAIERAFGKGQIPDFSSTKAFTGHTLAAAASVEAVYSILALQKNVVFPNLNFKNPIKNLEVVPQTQWKSKHISKVLSNSFGFGGNCSTLIFSK